MKYYTLIKLGDNYNHPEYCFVKGSPSIISDKTWSLSIGRSLEAFYPDNPLEVTLSLDEDHPGLKLPSLIGNGEGYFLIHKDVIPVLKEHRIGEVEFWPFTLINHKGRVHSQDYVFAHLIGDYDYLDWDKSDVRKDRNGITTYVADLVFDAKKLQEAPICSVYLVPTPLRSVTP